MRTVEIPREAWVEQLNEFTAAHEGWLVSLDVIAPGMAAQSALVNVPLLGVSADRMDHDGTVVVSVMLSPTGHFTHVITGVTRIFVGRVDNGADAALAVESFDGTTTMLRFRVAARSENADAR